MRDSKNRSARKSTKEAQTLIGYQRVSTDDQKLELQHDALTAAGVEPERIYEDKLSGAKVERPGLEHAIRAGREGDVLVVWRLDRLGRSLKDLIAIVERLEARGVGLRSLHENIDTTTASGRLFFHIMGALAEFERNLIRERTRAGLLAARRRGKKPGRKRKFRDKDLAAARALLREDELTVGEVAEKLGVSPATLYRYFPGGREGLSETSAQPGLAPALEPPEPERSLEAAPLAPPPELVDRPRLKAINEWLAVCPLPAEAFDLPKGAARPLRLARMTSGRYHVLSSDQFDEQGPTLGRTLYHALDGLWGVYEAAKRAS